MAARAWRMPVAVFLLYGPDPADIWNEQVHINKIHAVQTITLVARELGEDEDWLAGIAAGMEPQDGLIWVYSVEHEDGIMAYTEFGVESLQNLIAIPRDEMK